MSELRPDLPELEPVDSADFSLVTDVLLPVALVGLLGSLVWFLLDARVALVQSPLRLLRWIFGCFLVAVVGIARIQQREGGFDAAPYAVALLLVMALFGFLYAYGGGAFGSGYGGHHPSAALLYVYSVIALIWFGGNYIVTQTAIDPDDVEVQDVGLVSSEEWARHGSDSPAVRRRPHPGRAVIALSLLAVPIFGLGHKLLAGRPEQGHAFGCMVVYLACALAVLALSALSGLQLYARARGTAVPSAVAGLWLGLALPVGAVLLVFAAAAPRLEPAPNSLLPRLPPFVERIAREAAEAAFRAPWSGDEPPGESGARQAAGESGAPRPGEEAGGRQPGSGESGGEQGRRGAGGEQGDGGNEAGGRSAGAGAGQDSGQGRSDPQGQRGGQQQTNRPDPRRGLLLVLGLVVGALLLGWMAVRLWPRLRAWWAARRGAGEVESPEAARDPFVDPFGPRSPLRGRPASELVVQVYRAFQAYMALLGRPRREGVTAHDFLVELPASAGSWRDSIERLTDLYEAAEYTPSSVDESCLDELRAIWERLMQAVREARG